MHTEIKTSIVVTPTTWAEFVKYIDSTYKALQLQYAQEEEGYRVFALDGDSVCYQYFLWNRDTVKFGMNTEQNNADYDDFVAYYKPRGNKEIVKYVNQKQFFLVPPGRAITIEEGYELDCKDDDYYTTLNVHFPFDVDVLGGRSHNTNIQDGDYVNFWAGLHGDPSWGTVTTEALSGQNKVILSSTVLAELYPGVYVKLGSEFDKYRADSINYVSGEVTLNKNLAVTKNVNDEVRLYWPSAYHKWIPNDEKCDVGLIVLEASGFTPEWDMMIEYHHAVQLTADKKIRFNLVYRY